MKRRAASLLVGAVGLAGHIWNKRTALADAAGSVCLVVAGALVDRAVGFAVAGVLLLVYGVDVPSRKAKQ